MTKKLTLSRAKKILRVVPPSKSFWLCTNEYLRSLNTLADSLERVSDDVFRYHVDKYKNDFASWVKDCIEDKDLAREISRIKTRYTLIRKIRENVDEAKSLARRYKKVSQSRKTKKAKKNAAKPAKPKGATRPASPKKAKPKKAVGKASPKKKAAKSVRPKKAQPKKRIVKKKTNQKKPSKQRRKR